MCAAGGSAPPVAAPLCSCGHPLVPVVRVVAALLLGRSDHDGVAWILWGRRALEPDDVLPLGCYSTREVALEAQGLAEAHENADLWEDFWVTPWPLRTQPVLNFRMEMVS